MAIKISKIESCGWGTVIRLHPDAPNAIDYFKEFCEARDWPVKEDVPQIPQVRTFKIKGPSPDVVRAALQENSEFDLASTEIAE